MELVKVYGSYLGGRLKGIEPDISQTISFFSIVHTPRVTTVVHFSMGEPTKWPKTKRPKAPNLPTTKRPSYKTFQTSQQQKDQSLKTSQLQNIPNTNRPSCKMPQIQNVPAINRLKLLWTIYRYILFNKRTYFLYIRNLFKTEYSASAAICTN